MLRDLPSPILSTKVQGILNKMSHRVLCKKLFLVGFIFLGAQSLVYVSLSFLMGGKTKIPPSSLTEVLKLQESFLNEVAEVNQLLKELGCSPFILNTRLLYFVLASENENPFECKDANCTMGDEEVMLGVDSSCILKMEAGDFVKRLYHQEYSAFTLKNRKVVGLPPQVTVYKCAILLRKVYPFMVVILHNKEDNFWWHGSIYNDNHGIKKLTLAGLHLHSVESMHNEGVIPKMDFKEARILSHQFSVPQNVFAYLQTASKSESRYIECDYKRADKYFNTHGRDQSVKATRFKHQAWKLLSRAKRILDGLEVPFWLSSGTCLGYLRQCDFIPYSQDVDIGVFAENYKTEIIPAFLSHGFKLHHTFGKPEDSYQIAFEYNGIKLDVFFFYSDKGRQTIWNGGTEARSGKKFKYSFPAITLCWTEFLELLVKVPCDTVTYIEANYGKNWFTPVTKWSWKSSPPNVEKNGVWPKEEWADVIKL